MATATPITTLSTGSVESADEKKTRQGPDSTRRGTFAWLLGAPLLAATTASAATQEEPLEILWREHLQCDGRYLAAVAAEDAARDAATDGHPKCPVSLYDRVHGIKDPRPVTRESLERNIDYYKMFGGRTRAAAVARAERRLRLYDNWIAKCDRVDASHGLPQLEEAIDNCLEMRAKIQEKIIATPARSMRGALVKLMLADFFAGYTDPQYTEDDPHPQQEGRVITSLIRDLQKVS